MGYQESWLYIEPQRHFNKLIRAYEQAEQEGYLDYIYVDEIGDRIKPNYITGQFPKLLEKHQLKDIRFHDLRHPYVKHTTKIFSLRLKFFQAHPIPDALRKNRGAFLHLRERRNCVPCLRFSNKKLPCSRCRCAGALGVWLP